MPARASPELRQLASDYWESVLRFNPTYATFLGDSRYDDRLPDAGPGGREAERSANSEFLQRLNRIPQARLAHDDRITAHILRTRLELSIEGHEHKFYQWEIDQLNGPQVWLLELVNFQPFKTLKNFEDFCSRLEKFPGYVSQYIANLREGLREGRTAPRVAWQRVVNQLQELTSTPHDRFPVLEAARRIPKEWPATRREKIARRLKDAVLEAILPSYWELQKFLTEEYAAGVRDKVGVRHIAGGDRAYDYLVRLHTTASYPPRRLHEIGLDEVDSISREMKQIARRRGHRGNLPAFVQTLKKDASNFYRDRHSILEEFRRILRRVDERLPRFFGRLPKIGYVVKPIEEYREKDAPAAYYYGPPEDGSRDGIFYANTFAPHTRPRYNMAALAVHEAVPGHHLQIAISAELKDLPRFRRHGGFTAFVEGWALYTERLAVEMGIYESDLEHFGMLNYQAWRAARLVVDTGMHALGWTRERAVKYFRDRLSISDGETANEIDRYIIWPGQALAYKVGQREIAALRSRAEKSLGGSFDLRSFHDELLRHGGVPLSTLRQAVEAWIDSRRKE
jgi:prolyl oligopeptidase